MAFRYINPGFAELLDVKGGTTVTGEAYSRTGAAFWQPNEEKGISLSAYPTELYGKFDLYLKSPSTNPYPRMHIYIGHKTGIGLSSGRPWRFDGRVQNTSEMYLGNTADILRANAINTIWFHIKPGNGDGILHILANDHEVGYSNTLQIPPNYAAREDAMLLSIYSRDENMLISNLILSEEEIHPKEQVAMLPIQETQTDM